MPYLTVGRHNLGKVLWKVSQKKCPVALSTPLIKDFAHQRITDILEVILQQAEMLHPPFWYPPGREQ